VDARIRHGRLAGLLVAALVLSLGGTAASGSATGRSAEAAEAGAAGAAAGAEDVHRSTPRIRREPDGAARVVFGQPYLTGPSSAPAAAIARTYIAANQDLFALTDEQVEQLTVSRDYVTEANGAQHVAFEQRIDGIRVANRTLTFLLDADGRIVSAGGPLARGRTVGSAQLGARDALEVAIDAAPEVEAEIDTLDVDAAELPARGRRGNVERFENTFADVQHPNPVTAERIWYETDRGTLRPAYEVDFEVDGDHWLVTYVDAGSGRVLEAWNRYAHAAPQGTVFTGQHPNDSPARSVQPFSGTNGSWVTGEVTSGPNVNAYRDLAGTNAVGYQPDPNADGMTSQHFDYPWTDAWRTNADGTGIDDDLDAVVTQLFYYTNLLHEWSLGYGFDPAAGNFQDTDPVLAEAQDAWDADPRRRNNANFATPADGASPRMQMFMWDGTFGAGSEWIDGSMDGDVVAHEYGHGITHRLAGGSDALFGYNTHLVHASVSEGSSDVISFLLWGDSVIAEYVTGNAVRGIRRVAYDDSDHTYNTYNPNAGSGHPNGEVWATMIHDVRTALRERDGTAAGDDLTTWLYFTGLKAMPGEPDFLDARDAVIAADTTHTGGDNRCLLWGVFAGRGLGEGATFDKSSSSRPADDFDVPDGCAPNAEAGGPYVTPEGTDVTVTAAASTQGSDPTGGAIGSYEWDLDDDGEFDDAVGVTAPFTLVGDDGMHTVSVRVTNTAGITDVASSTVTVTNVDPTVTLDPVASVSENTPTTLSGVISDPGWLDVLTATVDWDDGDGPQPLTGTAENVRPDATLSFSVPFTYGDDGTFTIEVCGYDDDGGSGCATVDAVITNTDPTATIDPDLYLGVEGQPLDVSGASTDPGSDDLTATWDWGDGTTDVATSLVSPPALDPPKSPSIQPRDVTWQATHTYLDACLYDLGLEVEDDDGGSATDTATVIIVGTGREIRTIGWWLNQYRPENRSVYSQERLECYLAITRHLSDVFDEVRGPLTVREDATAVLQTNRTSEARELLDAQLLGVWLTFADGAATYDTMVVVDGRRSPAVRFEDVVRDAEAVRLDPTATREDLLHHKDRLERILTGKP
jgi:Zn-dependent metalloprotease